MFRHKLKVLWYWSVCKFSKVLCLLLFRVRTYGKENVPDKGPVLLLGNHQSYLDPIICSTSLSRQVWFVARHTLFKHAFLGGLITSLNTMQIKRGQVDLAAMKMIIKKLREGNAIILYPEATRSKDGKITAIKPGFGLLSRRAIAPVVPVLIDGAFEAWPRDKKFFRPAKITISFGKPISAQKIKDLGDEKFANLFTEVLRNMQTRARAKLGRKTYDYN